MFFPSLEKRRIQICKDVNELCGNIFLTFKILQSRLVSLYSELFKEPSIHKQNLTVTKTYASISTTSVSHL